MKQHISVLIHSFGRCGSLSDNALEGSDLMIVQIQVSEPGYHLVSFLRAWLKQFSTSNKLFFCKNLAQTQHEN